MKGIWIEASYSKLIKPSTLYQNFILLGYIDITPFGLIIFFKIGLAEIHYVFSIVNECEYK